MADGYLPQVRMLAWEICRPHQVLFLWIAGMLVTSILLNFVDGVSFNADEEAESLTDMLHELMFGMSVFLVFHIFSVTEFNSRRQRRGFPQRLFVLPVTSLILVAVPLVLCLVATEAVFMVGYWTGIALDTIDEPLWGALKLGVFALTYQMILWSIPALGSVRLILIGIAGFGFIVVEQGVLSTGILLGWGIFAFLWSWRSIVILRSGGRKKWHLSVLAGRARDLLPQRTKGFASMHSACLWYEWRQAGFMLPLTMGMLLFVVIAPLSVLVRDNANATRSILNVLVLAPLVLASVIGKGFSKADLWSPTMALPAFLAVKPLSNEELITAKMKVAALSTLLTWALVLAFVVVWLRFWANPELLYAYGNMTWALQQHSLMSQYVTVGLALIVCVLLTWRFQVAGLWIGLSSHRRWFTWSSVALAAVLMLGPAVYFELRDWISDDFARLHIVVWGAGALVAAKFWLAAWSWRGASLQHSLRYLAIWLTGTACTLMLVLLLSEATDLLVSLDNSQVRALLVFAALLVMPLAQLGLAPITLAYNRHR